MPILSRMLVAFGIIIAIGVVQSLSTVFSLRDLSEEIAVAASEPVVQVDAAHAAWDTFREASAHLSEVIEGIRYQPSKETIARFNELAAGMDAELARFKATELTAETAARVEDVQGAIATWKKNALVLLGEAPATAIPSPHVMERFRAEIRGKLLGLVEEALAAAAQSKDHIQSQASWTEWLTIALGAVGAIAGIGIAVPLALAITRPLARIERRMVAMTDGDVETPISDQERRDEIGRIAKALGYFREGLVERKRLEALTADMHRANEQKLRDTEQAFTVAGEDQTALVAALGKAIAAVARGDLTVRLTGRVAPAYEQLRQDFNEAVANLETIVGMVAATTDDIRVGVDEISQASGDLSQRTERQAAKLAESAGALDDVMATVQKTVEGVSRVQQAVRTADSEATASEQVVKSAIEAMGRIEKSSQSISQIIGVIDEIAFQTNLLALNAGVEAARAGESGRGFAVVASEVRALAQRSADAAKEIKALISSARPEVAQGVDLVGEAGSALERISQLVAAIDGVVSDMAAGAVEQASSLREISASIGQVDQVTQQNATMVEQSTAATYALQTKTEELTDRLSRFRIAAGGVQEPQYQERRVA